MRLKKLELKSFKGIKDFIIKPNGKSVSIHGDNGTGKTTIADSVAFLLYGLDSHGNTFLPKPLDETGEALHGVNSEVEAIFLLDDGQEITLKKSFYEKWTEKHGIAQKIFTGHTTKHSIDGVPNISEKKYKEKIGEIATEPILKLLTNTKHFSEGLHWQERRSILLDICGDISDEEIIAGNESLSRIPEILAGKTLEEQKKIITAQKTKLNKELNELPVRIDEVEKGLPDVSGLDLSVIEKELSETEKALAEKNQEAARIESGGEIAEKVKTQRGIESRLLEIENNINEIRNKAESEQRKQALEAETAQRKKVAGLETAKEGAQSSRGRTLRAIKDRETTNKAAEQEIIKLRVEWNTVNDKIFNEQDTICPTCGQEYPEEKADKIREKFHVDKAETLRKINENGRTVGAGITERKNLNETDQTNVSIYEEKIEEIEGQINEAKTQAAEPGKETEKKKPFKNKEQEALELDLAELKLNIEELRADSDEALEIVESEIAALSGKQAGVNLNKQTIKTHKKGLIRIKELASQQKTCAAKFEELEEALFIMDEFMRARAKMLEKSVNSHFEMAEFKLFNILVNGSLEPCCTVCYQGIEWDSGLNNSARINVGLDVINTLSKFYKLQLPVFIDNSESITKLIPTECQVIKLVVSKDCPVLTVIQED